MINLCKYKNIFGEPKHGIHSYRIFNIAIIDIGLTTYVSYLIAKHYSINVIYVFLIVMLISLIMHKLFCVDTTLTKFVFG